MVDSGKPIDRVQWAFCQNPMFTFSSLLQAKESLLFRVINKLLCRLSQPIHFVVVIDHERIQRRVARHTLDLMDWRIVPDGIRYCGMAQAVHGFVSTQAGCIHIALDYSHYRKSHYLA